MPVQADPALRADREPARPRQLLARGERELEEAQGLELGPHGITVNAVIPGLVNTSTSPLGVPWVEPEDVVPLVFFASDQARMVSGTSFAATAGDNA